MIWSGSLDFVLTPKAELDRGAGTCLHAWGMSEVKQYPTPSKTRRWRIWLAAILLLGVAVWVVHPFVLSWVLTAGIERWAKAHEMEFHARKVSARLDGPVVCEGLTLRAIPSSGNATSLEVERCEWRWNGFLSLFSENERLVRELRVEGVSGILDRPGRFRSAGAILHPRLLPREATLGIASLEIHGSTGRIVVNGLRMNLSETTVGQMTADSVGIIVSGYTKSVGPLSARTAWKAGTVWLADLEIEPGFVVDNFSLDLLHEPGPAISLSATCFGGSLRGDFTTEATTGQVEMAAWASSIPLDRAGAFAGFPDRMVGTLSEGRFTYRGLLDRPADAEASLRLIAQGFQWNKRGWESLVVGASLIHRRLVVTEFDLRQKENRFNFNGEISLADGWSQISKSPFLVTFRADIREVAALAGLVGRPFHEVAGRMSASGSVNGRQGELDGFLSIEASDLTFRSLPPASLNMEAVFRKNEIDVVSCEVFAGKDSASIKGTVGISAPHQYAAALEAKFADVAVYLAPFHAPGADQVYGGALDARWEGDGTRKSHSGAFDLKLRDFVSGPTPSGLTGTFIGTYSPQNLYFSTLQLDNAGIRLTSRATIARSGVTVKDFELKSGSTPLLEGGLFAPVNVFEVFAGKDWRAAMDAEREAYLRLSSPKDLSIPALLELAGQKPTIEGQVRVDLEAGGPPARLTAKGELSAHNLLWKVLGKAVPASSLTVKFAAADGAANFNGLLQTKKFPAVVLTAGMPFGLMSDASGHWRWLNPAQEFTATLDFPQTELALLQPFFPKVRSLSGTLGGKLDFSGTLAQPQMNGRFDIKNGALAWKALIPGISHTEAVLVFDGKQVALERFAGKLGGGKFDLTGTIGLAEPENPAWNLGLKAENVLLADTAQLRTRANLQLSLAGSRSGGEVEGTVALVDGQIRQRIEPLLHGETGRAATSDFVLPDFAPDSWGSWTLAVGVRSDSPVLVSGELSPGEIVPEISLRGTLAQPVPIGRLWLRNVDVFLPFGRMLVPEGRIDFLPDTPWNPFLDIRATRSLPNLDIALIAFGPLSEHKILLRSEPPLPQEDLLEILLARTPAAPPRFAAPSWVRPPVPDIVLGGDLWTGSVRTSPRFFNPGTQIRLSEPTPGVGLTWSLR